MVGPRFRLREAARRIRIGGLVAYPTEAVWGVGCDPLNREAVGRLLELKGRPMSKGLILIASDFEQLRPFVRPLDRERMAPVLASWPGPNTWLLPAAEGLPQWLCGNHDSLAVRVTAHPLAAALCRTCGIALVSTSANRSGQHPARSSLQVRARLGGGVDWLLNGALGGLARPTPIRDARTGELLRG